MSPYRLALAAVVAIGALLPSIGLSQAVAAAATIGIGRLDFVLFIGAVVILGGTSVAVGVTILWRKPGNRIGLVMVTGGLLLMSTFTAWPVSIVLSASGNDAAAGLANWWGTLALLPAITFLFPAIGILFPDEHVPGPRWRLPIVAAVVLLAMGTILQAIAPWRLVGDITIQNPLAIASLPPELSELGGAVAAIAT